MSDEGNEISSEGPDAVPPLSQEILLKGTTIASPLATDDEVAASESVVFRVLGELGQGGMGVVYRAEQLYPRRIVALKVLKRSAADGRSRKRFAREIEITGQLSHRGIGQLYFAGYLEDGQPFMAMEYIQGMPLASYAQAHGLSRNSRLELFLKVCDIIAYAHRQGVIHRDLKPSNILVCENGEPKVLDFGLASLPLDTLGTQLTVQGQMVGTLDYMSPEQADGRLQQVDFQSDVYTLGVLLYELLATRRPFDLSSVSIIDAIRVIKESPPRRLSEVNRAYRGDLDTIVHKAMCKDRSGRYPSVDELAADVRRWLAHEPIKARPPSAAYRSSRFVRRHRILVTSVCLIIVALSVGLMLAAREARRADAASRLASREAANSRLAEQSAMRDRAMAEKQSIAAAILLGDKLADSGDPVEARNQYENAWKLIDKNRFSTLEISARVADLDSIYAEPVQILEPRRDDIGLIALSSDQRFLAIGHSEGRLEIRDLAGKSRLPDLTLKSGILRLTFSPDGKFLLAGDRTSMLLWSSARREVVAQCPLDPSTVASAELGNDRVVYISEDRRFHQRMLAAPDLPQDLSPISRDFQAFGISGSALTLVNQEGDVVRMDLDSGVSRVLFRLPVKVPGNSLLIGDGRIAIRQVDHIDLVNIDTQKVISLPGVGEKGQLGFYNNGCVYATSLDGRQCLLFDASGQNIRRLPCATDTRFAFSANLGVTAGALMGLAEWSIAPAPEIRILPEESPRLVTAALSSDGLVAAIAGPTESIRLTDTQTGHSLGEFKTAAPAKQIAFTPSTTSIAALVGSDTLMLWDMAKPDRPEVFTRNAMFKFAISDDANLLVMALPGSVEFLRREGGKWISHSVNHFNGVKILSISHDGRFVFVLYVDGQAELRNADAVDVGPPSHDVPATAAASWGGTLLPQWDRATSAVWLWQPGACAVVARNPLAALRPIEPFEDSHAIWAMLDGDQFMYFNGADPSMAAHLKIELNTPNRFHLSEDGLEAMVLSRHGIEFIDLSLPSILRSLRNSQSELSLEKRAYLLGIGNGVAFSPELSKELDASTEWRDGFMLWSKGDLDRAKQVFRRAHGISEGTRRLLTTQLENAWPAGV